MDENAIVQNEGVHHFQPALAPPVQSAGAPSYMAPEQAAGSKEVGPPADVYGLGAILYECLTGRPPFRAATPLETMTQVLKDDPVPPARLIPKLSRDLDTICLKCLRKEPRHRYATAEELAADLRRFIEGRPVMARPSGAIEKAWKATKRRPALAASIAASVLALLAVVGVVIWKNQELQLERNAARAAESDADTLRGQSETAKVQAENQRDLAEHARNRAEAHVFSSCSMPWIGCWFEPPARSRARNPALQNERREVLTEAIAVYRSFSDEDSADPRIAARPLSPKRKSRRRTYRSPNTRRPRRLLRMPRNS